MVDQIIPSPVSVHVTNSISLGLPKIIADVRARMNELAANPSGVTDPFESVYAIVYQLTMRTVACDDIADSPELLAETLKLFETIDGSATPTAIIFPSFPSPAVVKRTIAGGRLYMIIKNIVDNRKTTGFRGEDPLQFLIDEGDSMMRIIEVRLQAFVLRLLVLILVPSSSSAPYLLGF